MSGTRGTSSGIAGGAASSSGNTGRDGGQDAHPNIVWMPRDNSNPSMEQGRHGNAIQVRGKINDEEKWSEGRIRLIISYPHLSGNRYLIRFSNGMSRELALETIHWRTVYHNGVTDEILNEGQL